MAEITQLTLNIKTNYPALYRTLGENPITLPNKEHPDVDDKVLHEYLFSLKELLKSHIETHSANKSSKS